MANCCEDKACEVSALRARHAPVLWIVLVINAIMFLVEGYAGARAHSTSLLADALDMLGDATVYGFTLFVLARSARWQARAAIAKGAFMLVLGLGVLAEAAHKMFYPVMPQADTMGIVGMIALAANLLCLFLLYRSRADNLNMRSTWLCSRNDVIANVGVLAAAGAGFVLSSPWPDLAVGLGIAGVFIHSAADILIAGFRAFQSAPRPERTTVAFPSKRQRHWFSD